MNLRLSSATSLWVLGYAAIAAASLWMRAAIPISVHESGVDDYLFIKLATYLKDGQWLGPYDNATLVKGMAYPAFIAAAFGASIPLKLAEHALYLAVAAMTVWFVLA